MIAAAMTEGANAELAERVLGRRDSLFAEDVGLRRDQIADAVRGARVLVVGGAGSIGSVSVALLLDYAPAALHVVDISENGLAELVRDLRSRRAGISVADFRTIPIDYGGPIMQRLLGESPSYDVVLDFAALKHVRSEKDVYSLLQMLDTNVVKHIRFKRWLDETNAGAAYFAVSTDKAANPTSLMGASKRLMEDLIFASGSLRSVTSARFANVAFSNGSLLQSFLIRLARRQPMAVPRDTKRYFVSLREAGDICLLAALCAPAGHLLVPRFDPNRHLRLLEDIGDQVLRYHGLEPARFVDERAARESVESLLAQGRYPLLVTPLDTSGEKPFEEFLGENETAIDAGFKELLAVQHRQPTVATEMLLEDLIDRVENPGKHVDKEALVEIVRRLLPSFQHVETGKNLDERV